METKFKQKIINVIPREQVGSNTYNRYKFQIAVAVELLIELLKEEKNFITLMDYLEDVVIIEDYENESPHLFFYQVKTKEKNSITINYVIEGKFLEKMNYNLNLFKDFECESILVSNNGISFNGSLLGDTTKTSLLDILNDPKKEDLKKKIISSISANEGIAESEIDISRFYLLTTTLALNGYDDAILGKWNSYLTSQKSKITGEAIQTVYQRIWNELDSRMSQKVPKNISSEQIIYEKKGISSSNIKKIIDTTYKIQFPKFSDIESFINDYQYPKLDLSFLERKAKYDMFQYECIENKKAVLELIFDIWSQNIAIFRPMKPIECISKLDELIQCDTRISNLTIYEKYSYYFKILYLLREMED
jgi:hypothetical protein